MMKTMIAMDSIMKRVPLMKPYGTKTPMVMDMEM